MEVIYFFETSVDFQRTTLHYITEDSTLHNHRCENLIPTKTGQIVTNAVFGTLQELPVLDEQKMDK
jgi:hypothetical protein